MPREFRKGDKVELRYKYIRHFGLAGYPKSWVVVDIIDGHFIALVSKGGDLKMLVKPEWIKHAKRMNAFQKDLQDYLQEELGT